MGTTGKRLTAAVATTLTFEKFWTWLGGHANCIVRAGTPEAVLLDLGIPWEEIEQLKQAGAIG